MDATTTRQQRPYDAAKLTSSNTSANKAKVEDKDAAPSSDPAALRARLKHRAPGTGTSATTAPASATYNRVLDTAQQLAELERLRAQDAAYIRLLEQGRATLVRDAHAGARERAVASTPAAVPQEDQQQQQQRRKAEEAERAMRAERERAERAETRVRALEEALGVAKARAVELEGAVASERKRREEWESGLEQLAMGVPAAGSSAAARL
ncbi:hypothetical protein EDB84DRAFT_935820 [Lactarius hengduanensis]|nr:hypothetical protein EDB84DRAFT_935820 [Lactarius hengduanensis]